MPPLGSTAAEPSNANGLLCSLRGGGCLSSVFLSRPLLTVSSKMDKISRTNNTYFIGTMVWDVPPSCPAAQPVLPISNQPNQNQAEGGTAKIKVNPTQVRQEMCHPV